MNMFDDLHFSSSHPIDGKAKAVLKWLAVAHGRTGSSDAEEVHQQLLLLRESPTPTGQRSKLLDLLFKHVERVVSAELPALLRIRAGRLIRALGEADRLLAIAGGRGVDTSRRLTREEAHDRKRLRKAGI